MPYSSSCHHHLCHLSSNKIQNAHILVPVNPAGICQGYPVAPCVPPETEADPVQRLFCQLNLASDGLLVMFRL